MDESIRAIFAKMAILMLATGCGQPQPLPIPVVNTARYGMFRLRGVGDSICGTISADRKIEYDCGPLASSYAHPEQGWSAGRLIASRTENRVAATILRPPREFISKYYKYYPINVFSADLGLKEEELLCLAFQIGEAVLEK
jgi:hypothetical protein